MSDLVHYAHRGPAAVLTINRPAQRNALSRALIAALSDAFRRAADDPKARSVILTGTGSAFCAGMDLEELRGSLGAESGKVWDDAAKLSELYDFIYTLPKPTIAAVNGSAVAGGELIDAVEALRMRLINQVTAPEHMMEVVDSVTDKLAMGGPKAIATTKDLLRRCSRQSVAVDELARASAEPRLSDECHQGLTAFFEKKPAPWATGADRE
jgi:methylglutaconyl-CoA hydratase